MKHDYSSISEKATLNFSYATKLGIEDYNSGKPKNHNPFHVNSDEFSDWNIAWENCKEYDLWGENSAEKKDMRNV